MPEKTDHKILDKTLKHYENFPVASFLIPKHIRKDVAIIYWFARTADDLADEGILTPDERIKMLNDFENEFFLALKNKSVNKLFILLRQTIRNNNLTESLFFDLLSAFRQDITKKRYSDFSEVLKYCQKSANPVGRLILELVNIRDEKIKLLSDKICTALQLTNFYQDTKADFQKGRVYYPSNEMSNFNVSESFFELQKTTKNLSSLVKFNVDRAQLLFDQGKEITKYLPGRMKLEIKWTIAGGEKILDKIRKNSYDVFSDRPQLSKLNYFSILVKSFFNNV